MMMMVMTMTMMTEWEEQMAMWEAMAREEGVTCVRDEDLGGSTWIRNVAKFLALEETGAAANMCPEICMLLVVGYQGETGTKVEGEFVVEKEKNGK
ncbi:hypothetical protein CYMTET_28505 [Cymbomonas tetramitiformis]|uniref:Uncharacterized protein n=1 Tax=Cymbomonas tetramitiformis TaxID=36881 RepID=A0AAE0FMS3_9CHLO|nr:hypothetical protein CYMTET_28505 [Cymbomonas tetramitiformis]